MDFFITEKQFEQILTESENNKLSENLQFLYSSLVNTISKVQRKYGINLKMLLTWGPAVGGVTAPLDTFIRNGQFQLNDNQIALLVCSAFFMAFFENRKQTKQLKSVVEEEGLTDLLEGMKNKAIKLKKSFAKFLKSSGIVLNNVNEALAYSFLIPIITDVQEAIVGSEDKSKIAILIVKRLIASGVLMMSSEIVYEAMKKLSKKLSQ